MKKSIACLIVMCVAFTQCTEENPVVPGLVKFSLGAKDISGGRVKNEQQPTKVFLRFQSQSTLQEEEREIDLYAFGSGGFVSESIQLPEGNYKLLEFLVLNAAQQVLYVCPVSGSEHASLVNSPLPIDFVVVAEQSTTLALQVVPVEGEPEDYGYANFGFEIIDLPNEIHLSFLVAPQSHFETEGYDSVRMMFIQGGVEVVKNLQIISPVEAVGKLIENEISMDEPYTIKLLAYHESIDEVPNIDHTIEVSFEKEITPEQQEELEMIAVRTDGIKFHTNEGHEDLDVQWQYNSHLLDHAGNYHLMLSNNFCSPEVTIVTLKTSPYFAYIKSWKNDQTGDPESVWHEWLAEIDVLPADTYHDSQDIACSTVASGDFEADRSSCPSFQFFHYANDESYWYSTCLVVWQSAGDPYDPNPAGRTKQNSNGYFKLVPAENIVNPLPNAPEK
ncbi:MAG TPA: hypothetical protein VGD31_01830 [Sphingobacteriaceae bacterium]